MYTNGEADRREQVNTLLHAVSRDRPIGLIKKVRSRKNVSALFLYYQIIKPSADLQSPLQGRHRWGYNRSSRRH